MDVVINGKRYIPAPPTGIAGWKSLGENLYCVRMSAGYSLDEAAEKMDMSKSQLWELENNKQDNPTLKTIKKIMGCYGLSISDLLGP